MEENIKEQIIKLRDFQKNNLIIQLLEELHYNDKIIQEILEEYN